MTSDFSQAAPTDAYSVLLKFLYRAPVAMVQTDTKGQVELMTPVAANYLLPLSGDGNVDNLLTVLEPRLPGISARALMPPPVDSVICSRWRFTALAPAPRIFELDGRHVGSERLHWTLSDVTAEVQTQAAERAALVGQIQRLTTDLTTAVQLTGIVMLRTPLPRSAPAGEGLDALATFQSLIRAEDQPAFEQDLQQAQAGGAGVIREFAVRTPGGIRWMVGRHSVDQPPGQTADLLTLCIDVTHQHEAARAREAQQAAELASAAKTDFLLSLSHELRTPLNGIMGLSELLLHQPADELTPAHREMIVKIHGAGTHLASLLEDLLDVGAIERGQVTSRSETVDVLAVLQAALDDVKPLATQFEVTLALADLQRARFVAADPTRLRQVLLNLLTNAIKYNRRGGRVDVHTEGHGDRVAIVVRDSGLGMSRPQLDRLFSPFDRAGRERSQVGGLGVGLYLSKRLVEAMGGTIGVNSTPEQGSTFRVELAAAEAAAVPWPPVTAPVEAEAVRDAEVDVDVLCVDDNPINREVFECFCAARERIHVRTTALGADFLAEARRKPPDLAVVDLELPDMTGWQIIDTMRADPLLRDTPVLICSSSRPLAERAGQMTLQGVSFLGKPVGMDQFLAEVDRLTAKPRP